MMTIKEHFIDMTQEEKQLLLKDLCARLPYWVKVSVPNGSLLKLYSIIDCKTAYLKVNDYAIRGWKVNIEEIKPYLCPMSSMTEEEEEKYNLLNGYEKGIFPHTEEAFDWLNAHHFDYRGLIPMGLAIEAPKGMYKDR